MRYVAIALLSLALALSSACWRKAETVQNTNAEAAVTSQQFADAQQALAEGKRLLDENQTDAAIEALKQSITLDPDLGEAHFNLGIAYALQEHQLEQTGERLPGETVEGNKQYKPRSDKAFERAVEAFEKWLKANPDDDNAHFYLGRTYSKLLKDEEAVKELKEAVRIKPEDTEYQTELGAALIKLARYHEAVGVLKKAVELDDSNDRAAALLEDAEAGRKRIDYISKSNSNTNSNKSANANAAVNGNSNSGPPAAVNRPASNSPQPSNARPTPQKEVPRPRTIPTPGKTPGRPN